MKIILKIFIVMEYFKVLNEQMNHHGFQYQLGLNVDTKEFNPKGSCEVGGLYYTTKEHLHKFVSYGCFIAHIQIPNDAQVYADPQGDKWKADRLIINKIEHFADSEICQTPEMCLKAVKQDGRFLQYVKNQTPTLCLEAVKENGWALQYVKEQTHEICLEAVKKNGWALSYVKEKTPEIIQESDKYVSQYIKNLK